MVTSFTPGFDDSSERVNFVDRDGRLDSSTKGAMSSRRPVAHGGLDDRWSVAGNHWWPSGERGRRLVGSNALVGLSSVVEGGDRVPIGDARPHVTIDERGVPGSGRADPDEALGTRRAIHRVAGDVRRRAGTPGQTERAC